MTTQQDIASWARRNFDRREPTLDEARLAIAYAGLVEEVGELGRCIVKMTQGIRGTREEWLLEAEKEVGDCLIKIDEVAYRLQINTRVAMAKRWEEVSRRDWVADPTGHGLPAEPEFHDDNGERCEGCSVYVLEPHLDSEGVPLCDDCWSSLVAEADHEPES